jgi:hypothetical protein
LPDGNFVQQKTKNTMSKKTIAIVGATEKEGTQIAGKIANKHNRLLLVSENMEKLISLQNILSKKDPDAEIETIECVKDGCWEADIILLAVQPEDEKKVAEMMKEVATQKIVGSLSENTIPVDELQKILPYSRLVKVSGISDSKNISVTGNDAGANKEILDIFLHAGLPASIINNKN